jgi:TPP-dependent pyruvate/acetoin dehydrogenase alpha subunit
VVASFFGDGAVEEGAFHESIHFAVLKRLPVLFVCENNFYAIHTPLAERQPLDNIRDRAASYGLPAERLDHDDVLTLHARMGDAVARIRAGHGPAFFECRTYRWREHVGPGEDFQLGYRTRAEAEPWMARDSVAGLAARIEPAARHRLEGDVDAEIEAAIRFAEASPFPSEDALHADLFTDR